MSKIYDCAADLQRRMQLIAGMAPAKVFICYDPADLSRQLYGAAAPGIGVVYEGSRANSEQGGARQGTATKAVFGLYLALDTPSHGTGINQKVTALDWLENMRQQVLHENSPSGHPWRFMIESLVDAQKDRAIWVQRWETPVIQQKLIGG